MNIITEKLKLLIIFGFLCNCCDSYKANKDEQIFHISLNQDSSIQLDWMLDYINNIILFELKLPSNFGWFAFGFSDRGGSYPGDYCVLWRDWKHNLHFEDSWADENGVLSLDKQQNCLKIEVKEKKDVTKYIFERKFDTCDVHDYIIEDGTTHLVWARGYEKLYQLQGLNISTNEENCGMTRTQLLKNTAVSNDIPKGAQELSILTNNVKVPGVETTYWCHVHKLPPEFKNKHHVLQYESAIEAKNEGLVHHMEVFHCMAGVNEEIPLYKGSCFAKDRPEKTQVCKRVLAAWAMGAKAFVYPDDAALPIGGPDFNPYIMLEVHYNNPEKRADFMDSSGIKFYVTQTLRSMDAGVIELGLEYTDKMAIPPGQMKFPLTGYCVSQCTAVSLPADGITIFGSQLHTHLTGTKVVTRHFRDGYELLELNRDNHYSTHFQEIRRLKRLVRVLPGDALITTCDYNTEGRQNITLGGFAITDEMCVNYIHYFPATALEVCKSAISDHALKTYFQYMHEWENQEISSSIGISTNYESIVWNKMRVELLREVYAESPLSMQCNMSSGDRFPGYWENTPITPILIPEPPPIRHCSN